ncbi:MAG: YbaK/EbsC family protein [Nakamurella sp.]
MTLSPDWLSEFNTAPAAQHPELLAPPVTAALGTVSMGGTVSMDDPASMGYPAGVLVAPIDSTLADTAAFCAHYGVPEAASANCVITVGKRGGEERFAAVVVLATMRADINGMVRRHIDVRKISFAPMDTATSLTGMEYGGITPIGLPADWPILIDRAVTQAGLVVIGSGIRASKIIVDGAGLAALPNAVVLDGLGQ